MSAPPRDAPKFLNLAQIRFPIGAIASIGHRVSGVLLLLSLPFLVLALERSLRSEADYAALGTWLNSPWRALLLVVMVWAATHHLLAGVRHMLMDIGIGSRLAQARMSAWSTIVAALLIALVTAVSAAMRWLS